MRASSARSFGGSIGGCISKLFFFCGLAFSTGRGGVGVGSGATGEGDRANAIREDSLSGEDADKLGAREEPGEGIEGGLSDRELRMRGLCAMTGGRSVKEGARRGGTRTAGGGVGGMKVRGKSEEGGGWVKGGGFDTTGEAGRPNIEELGEVRGTKVGAWAFGRPAKGDDVVVDAKGGIESAEGGAAGAGGGGVGRPKVAN